MPSKRLDDDTVCAICGFPSARRLRDLEHISLAPAICSRACPALVCLPTNSTWLGEVATAWRQLCDSDCTLSPSDLVLQWQDQPQHTVATVRAVKRLCRLECKAARTHALQKAKAIVSAAFTGWVDFNLVETAASAQHHCNICGQRCAIQSGLAVHQLHSHGITAHAGAAGNATLCLVCGTEYWEQHRLRDHLRKNPACLVPLLC